MALGHLGMNDITLITDSTPTAQACNKYWLPALKDIYREARIPFSTVMLALVDSTTTSGIIGYTYIYTYPSTAITVWAVFDEGSQDKRYDQDFEVLTAVDGTAMEKVICTTLDDAYAEYTYLVTDPEVFDPKFALALSYRLASIMAHTLVRDPEKGLRLLEISNIVLGEAKRINKVEQIKKPPQSSGYVNSR